MKIQSFCAGSIISAFQCKLTLPVELIVVLTLNSPIGAGHRFRFGDVVIVSFEFTVSFCARTGHSSHAKIVRRINDGNWRASISLSQ